MKRKSIFSIASILSGTIIGAGIFSIPYVISQVGVGIGFFYTLAVGLINLLAFLLLAEVIDRTKGEHQMSGYAGIYLGKWGKGLMTFTALFGNLGAILVYMIGIGDFLFELLNPYIGGSPFLYSSLFFIIASLAILAGLGMIVQLERIMIAMILLIVGFFIFLGFPQIDIQNIVYSDFSQIFIPYGVLLFAFGGMSAIPEMRRFAGEGGIRMKKAIYLGTAFPFVVYILFSFAVVGVTGSATSPEAIIGLSAYLGPGVVALGALLGVFTMGTSFLTLGIITKNLLSTDFKINPVLAWVITCFVPYAIYLLGLTSFIQVITIVGSVTGGLYGIMIIYIHRRAKKLGTEKPSFTLNLSPALMYPLISLFVLGIVYEVVNLFF